MQKYKYKDINRGNIAAVLTYIAAKGTGLDDNFEKWISKNYRLRKYVDLFTLNG